MLFPVLAARLLARNALASSKLQVARLCVPVATSQITLARNFSVSSVAWAASRAGGTASASKAKKPAAKKTAVRKRPAAKTTKKTTAAAKKRKPAAKKKVAPKRKRRVAAKRHTPRKIILRGKPELKPPKRPAAPFLLFFIKYRAGLQRPEGTTTQEFAGSTSREAGAAWAALSEQEKQTYHDEFAILRAAHKQRREEYMKNVDPAVLREINKQRKKRGKTLIHARGIGRPTFSGYLMYLIEQRAMMPSPTSRVQNQELTRQVAASWKTLTPEQQVVYKRQAEAKNAELKAQKA